MWTVSPERFGMANCVGPPWLTAPNFHPPSAMVKKLVASGAIAHAGATAAVVAVFDAMVCSCPAPRPRVIRATAPQYALGRHLERGVAHRVGRVQRRLDSGCSSRRQ